MNKLGVYVHIPFCNGKCAYCDFVSGVYDEEVKRKYFAELLREIGGFDFGGYEIDTVYFGGGTPSSVSPEYISGVLDALRSNAFFSDEAEITLECNPESFDEEKAKKYAETGINRLSFGLQSATDSLLKKIGRLHDTSEFLAALDIAEKYFDNISADLMLGLPGQTKEDVIKAIDLLSGRKLKHISVYALKVEEGTPLASSGYATDEDYSAELYDIAFGRLCEHDYRRYEVSNFAFPGFESKHNLKYWRRNDYVGFGVAAHSFVHDTRYFNTSDIDMYIRGTHTVDRTYIDPKSEEAAEETIMLALRTAEGLDLGEYARMFGRDLSEYKRGEIDSLAGYMEVSDGHLRLTEKGFYLMNGLIVRLLD